MPYLPPTIPIKGAIVARNIIAGVGVFFGLAGFGGFSAGDPAGGLACGGIALVCFVVAAKVKTHKRLTRGGGIYE